MQKDEDNVRSGKPVEPVKQAKPNIITALRQHPLFVEMLFVVIIIGAVLSLLYWQQMNSRVEIDNAQISAPLISLGPAAPGVLERFYVQEGDQVGEGQILAKVDDSFIRAKTGGIIVSLQNTPGQVVTNQNPVVTMLDPGQLRVVGYVQEDKGLSDIEVGQPVIFSVDSFGGKEYQGVVESVALTAQQSDIVFSISDQREERNFAIKVKFDTRTYPELRNGMSAKIWVYKQ